MRTLITLTIVGILILATGSASAESYRQEFDTEAAFNLRSPLQEMRGHAILKLSPMYLEIYEINKTATEVEHELLTELAVCQDEDQVMRMVHRLERLNTDRQIDVLKVRVRYARLEGRFDQAFRLRLELLELLQGETASLM